MATLTPTPTADPAAPARRGRRWPAVLTLALASPLIAEVALGNLPFSQAWTLVFFGWVYAAGALLVREIARRRGLGLGGLLALGLAYAVLEEGWPCAA